MRKLAVVWAGIILLSVCYLTSRIYQGLPLRTGLLALLPREDQDPALRRANDAISRSLARRVIALVGHSSREHAREAAERFAASIATTRVLEPKSDILDADQIKRLGQLYFPYRRGLLAKADRDLLIAGRGEEVATRAIAEVFGVGSFADGDLIRADPF